MNKVIAIGALGGSGTRVVAEILLQYGIFMGCDLNNAFDNLLFTRLFKNPAWYNQATLKDLNLRFRIFEKLMQGETLNAAEETEMYYASSSNPTFQSKKSLEEVIREHKRGITDNEIWGWKEPNTQIYIEALAAYFSTLKYIHVIRHGLDMAFSLNQQQLNNWGYKFGISITDTETKEELSIKQLDYWIRSSQQTIKVGKQNLGSNYYLLNHQQLCLDPEGEIMALFQFLELPLENSKLEKLSALPQTPATDKRYLKEDISIFDSEQINSLQELGFTI